MNLLKQLCPAPEEDFKQAEEENTKWKVRSGGKGNLLVPRGFS